jgi:hypothetical protein
MGFETLRHQRNTDEEVSAAQSCQGASNALDVHPGKREPPPSHPPRKAYCRTPASHRTRSVRLRTAPVGRTSCERPDLAFHARLMELALQAANTHSSKGAMKTEC